MTIVLAYSLISKVMEGGVSTGCCAAQDQEASEPTGSGGTKVVGATADSRGRPQSRKQPLVRFTRRRSLSDRCSRTAGFGQADARRVELAESEQTHRPARLFRPNPQNRHRGDQDADQNREV